MTIAVKSRSHLIIAFLAPFRERVDALLAGGFFFFFFLVTDRLKARRFKKV